MAEVKKDPAVKIPPQNIDAEQSVLGALLVDKDSFFKVAEKISTDDFYREDHREIFDASLSLFEKRAPVDLVTLTDELRKRKKLDAAGGVNYLTSLANNTLSAAHIEKHAEIVREKAVLRRLITAATQIIEESYDEKKDIPAILDKSEQVLFSVSQRFVSDQFTPIRSILVESFDRINELHENKGQLRGVPTGFKELDNLLAGFQKSDLIILAARPSMGKTSLALNIADHAACEQKIGVAIFSLEMSKEQIIDRFLAMRGAVDSWKLRTGNLEDDDFGKLNYAMGVLSEAPIYIDDTPFMNVMELRAKSRRLQMEHGLGLIIIDYLQLMSGVNSKGADNRVQEVSEISRSLKALGRELNVPVLALSQLSRAVEHRDNKKPLLADLRESGSIEQDADVVMFIYRDDYYDKETENKNIAEVLVRKHRNGPTGECQLFFKQEYMKFGTLEKKMDSPE